MPDEEEMRFARLIGDLAADWIATHERLDHRGEHCAPERANLLAYIAHRIGWDIFGEEGNLFADRLVVYVTEHKETSDYAMDPRD